MTVKPGKIMIRRIFIIMLCVVIALSCVSGASLINIMSRKAFRSFLPSTQIFPRRSTQRLCVFQMKNHRIALRMRTGIIIWNTQTKLKKRNIIISA